jgi:hypothetical protein
MAAPVEDSNQQRWMNKHVLHSAMTRSLHGMELTLLLPDHAHNPLRGSESAQTSSELHHPDGDPVISIARSGIDRAPATVIASASAGSSPTGALLANRWL